MRLFDFIRSLLPRLSKDEVLEDLRITSGELDNGVIPVYQAAVKFFKTGKFNSSVVKDLDKVFFRNYSAARGSKQGNLVAEIAARLPAMQHNLKWVEDQNDNLLERDIIKDGLTAKKAVLVRSAEQLSFMTRYAMDLLNLIYIKETKDAGGEAHDLVPIEESRIINNVGNCAQLLAIFGDEPEKFKKRFDDMPDVVVNDRTYHALAAVYNESKIDPVGSLLIKNFDGSPIYHLRLMVAEWQANRYKSYKDKKRMLELRLLNLQLIEDKSPDPKVEREISYIQERIEGLDYKMRKMEESVS